MHLIRDVCMQDLFSYYQDEEENLTHSMLHCECDGSGSNLEEAAGLDDKDNGLFETDEDEEWSIPGIDQLVRWQHYAPCFDPALMQVGPPCSSQSYYKDNLNLFFLL